MGYDYVVVKDYDKMNERIFDKMSWYIDALIYAVENDNYRDIVKYYMYLMGFIEVTEVFSDSTSRIPFKIVTSIVGHILTKYNPEYREASTKLKGI